MMIKSYGALGKELNLAYALVDKLLLELKRARAERDALVVKYET